MPRQLIFLLADLGLLVPVIHTAALYVAPNGNDAGAGTQQQPFTILINQ